MIELRPFSSAPEWLSGLLGDFQTLAATRPAFHVALSGGSTPKPFYDALNAAPLPWDRITWWMGDERCVPITHPDSNERMVRESLGKGRADFDAHFRSWHLAPEPEEAAAGYGQALRRELGQPPVFDLILLGLGTDGHTASLFPETAALHETRLDTCLNAVPQLQTTRFTLTYPVLNHAREVWFLIKGHDKDPMVQRLIQRDVTIPSARITAAKQIVYWLK